MTATQPATALQIRIATALVLIPPVVAGVLMLPTLALAFVFGTIALLGAMEWATLIGISRYGYATLVGIAMIMSWWLIQNTAAGMTFLSIAVIAWLGGFSVVWHYPRLPTWWHSQVVQAGVGLVVLIPAWAALITLHGGTSAGVGPGYTLFLLVLVWIADSAAFFAGRRWGRRRLAPRVSPAKTVEGLLGAGVATLVIALLGAWWLDLATPQWPRFMVLCVVTLLASVVGDLLESVMKRTYGAKDSGILLPGHGGILDRIDSMTAAAPVFVVGIINYTHQLP